MVRNKTQLLSGLLCSVALVSSVAAQEENEDNIEGLERIIVQAQKTSQNLQDVPVAVSVFSGTALEETVSLDIFDIQNYVPAFAAFQSQSVTNSSFSVRGVGTSSQNFGFESSVGLYVDGVYRSRQNALINDLIDISTIEILRGPQGTLFGKNTPAGAVTINTVAPGFDSSGFAELVLANDNLIRLAGAKDLTLIDDTLAMRISGFKTRGDGFVSETESNNTLNNKDRWGAKLQLLYTPSEQTTVRIIADYGELDERCCAALTWQGNLTANDIPRKFGTDTILAQPPFNATLYTKDDYYDFTTSLSQPPLSQMEDQGLSVQIDHEFSDALSLVSISAYRSFDSLDIIDTDFSNADLLTATNDASQQSFSQELRLHYTTDKARTIAGLYYFSQNLDLDFNTTTQSQFDAFFAVLGAELLPLAQGIDQLSARSGGLIAPSAAPAPGNTAFAHSANQEQDSYALFLQTDWLLSDKLTLTTGLRQTWEDKSIEGQFTEQGPGINNLPQDPRLWPNPTVAVGALQDIGLALATGNFPSAEALAGIAPFQQAGWGYFFLGSAAVLPRPPLNEELNDNQLTGTLKLAYAIDKDSLVYGGFSTGYKAGGTNTDRILTSLDPIFEAEKAQSWEIGYKLEVPHMNLRVNTAAHYSQIKDFQATTFTGTGFNLQNAGDISVKGLELEALWQATENTQITLAAAHTNATFDTFERGTCWVAYTWHTGIDDTGRSSPTTPYCDRSSDRLGFEPENTLAISVNQDFVLANQSMRLSIDYQYTGDLMLDDSNDPYKQSESYSLVNARLLVPIEQWDAEITLWSRNLLNEEYVARNGFDVPVQAGKIMAYPGAPRSYGLSMRKQF